MKDWGFGAYKLTAIYDSAVVNDSQSIKAITYEPNPNAIILWCFRKVLSLHLISLGGSTEELESM